MEGKKPVPIVRAEQVGTWASHSGRVSILCECIRYGADTAAGVREQLTKKAEGENKAALRIAKHIMREVYYMTQLCAVQHREECKSGAGMEFVSVSRAGGLSP